MAQPPRMSFRALRGGARAAQAPVRRNVMRRCPPGTFSPDTTLSSLSECTSCPGGLYCQVRRRPPPPFPPPSFRCARHATLLVTIVCARALSHTRTRRASPKLKSPPLAHLATTVFWARRPRSRRTTRRVDGAVPASIVLQVSAAAHGSRAVSSVTRVACVADAIIGSSEPTICDPAHWCVLCD